MPKKGKGSHKLSTNEDLDSVPDSDVYGVASPSPKLTPVDGYHCDAAGGAQPSSPAGSPGDKARRESMQSLVPEVVVGLPEVVVVDSKQQWRSKWWNTIVEAAGALAGCCTTAAFIPQVVEVYVTGDTDGLSLPMYCIFVTGVVMWIVYGVCKKAGAMIGANVVTFVLAGYILYRILDNEIFHPKAIEESAELALRMLPPGLPPASPPLASEGGERRALLEQMRSSKLWRALKAI